MDRLSTFSQNFKRSRFFITLIAMLFTTKVLSLNAFSEKFPLGSVNASQSDDSGERSFAVGDFKADEPSKLPTIKQVFKKDGKTKVIIFLPDPEVLLESELNTYRKFTNYANKINAQAISGKLHLETKSQNLAIAEVISDGSEQLEIVAPNYNEIMVGDTVKSMKKKIRQKIQLVKDINLEYRMLFLLQLQHQHQQLIYQ